MQQVAYKKESSDSSQKNRLEELLQSLGVAPKLFYGAIIPIDLIYFNPDQPRKVFHKDSISDMADTMKDGQGIIDESGIEEPIKLTPYKDGFMVIDGERRVRAAKKAGLTEVPAHVEFDLSDKRVLHKSILANFCREDMSLVEQAFAYESLMKMNNWSQVEVARRIGKSQGHVTNALKVFRLDERIRKKLLLGEIEPGLALHLTSYRPSHQLFLLDHIKKEVVGAGKNISPQGINRLVRKEAERQGFNPVGSKRGRKIRSSLELAARALMRALNKVATEIEEVEGASSIQLKMLKEPSINDLLIRLKQTQEWIEDAISKLEGKVQ